MKTINYYYSLLFWLISSLISFTTFAQDCESKVTIQLNNIKGGVYANQTVTLKSLNDSKTYTLKSSTTGEAVFMLPCNQKFEVSISNYTRKNEISSPVTAGSYATRNFSYEPDMAKKDESFAMSEAEKKIVDADVAKLPDTTQIKNSVMFKPLNMTSFTTFTLTLVNLEGQALVNEQVIFTGEKSNKSFKGATSAKGTLLLYLPKGDKYSVNFKHQKDFSQQEVLYSKGTSTGGLKLMYLGTPEVEHRMKLEAERILAEEKRLKEEEAAFKKWCKDLKISEEEGHKRKIAEATYGTLDTVVSATLNRNKWTEKLIVCDLTGSMNPYANQLSAWYQLNYKKEQNLQFVFFNDGDSKADEQKVIGNTGGIYYQKSKGLDSLINLMSKVRSRGSGGDCPENNMEALIKGVKMAAPYKELVMIVDNNAPVKDIQLLKSFSKPVHIILCGSNHGEVLLDYLLIAWKTKGSIHTIEEDLYKIAGMLEGESITVSGISYKIMGGQFVRVSKL
jgi:hypothetical protein